MRKVLVLGGAGFIGLHLTQRLDRSGVAVRILCRSSRSVSRLTGLIGRVDVHIGDFQDEYVLKKALEGVDVVFHLVTTTFPNTSPHSGVYDVQTNLLPTIRLMELCEAQGVERVIYLSSGGTIYGEPKQLPITEDHPLDPVSIYGNSKKLIENYLDFFNKHSNLDITILRASNPYGPGQNPYGIQGVIAVACGHLLDDSKFPVIGDGSAVRDYIYIEDLIDAIMLAAKEKRSFTVNVSSQQGVSVEDLLRKLESVAGKKIEREYLPDRADLVSVNVLSNERAKAELNWLPRVSMEEGLKCTLDWVSSQYRGQ